MSRERMAALAASFPSLRELPGVEPFEPHALDHAGSVAYDEGTKQAAAFVLDVWNCFGPWACRFSLGRAMRVWDDEHRAAFQAWVQEPFLP